jgi:hypothetical protein
VAELKCTSLSALSEEVSRMTNHNVDVALWQRGLFNDEREHEIGPACYLFEASVSVFSALLRVLANDPVHYDSNLYGSLRNEFRKFYMWNEGFSTRTGDLDHVLACSKNLKGTVLGLMVQWAQTVSKSASTCHSHRVTETYSI